MMRPLFLMAVLALAASPASGQQASGSMAEVAFQALVDANQSYRKNDTVELLQGLLLEAEPGSETALRLTYRLAAVYYRQLKFRQAEQLIAALPDQNLGTRSNTSLYAALGVRDGMIYRVKKGDLPAALALGKAAVPRYTEALAGATLAEEIIESAYADTTPGSAARESIEARRGGILARTVKARLELAKLLSAIGEVHHALREYPPAGEAYRAALALFDKEKGSDAESVLQTRSALAILLRTLGDATAALPLQQAALAEMKKIFPPTHPDRLESERELKLLQSMLNKAGQQPRTGKQSNHRRAAVRGEASK